MSSIKSEAVIASVQCTVHGLILLILFAKCPFNFSFSLCSNCSLMSLSDNYVGLYINIIIYLLKIVITVDNKDNVVEQDKKALSALTFDLKNRLTNAILYIQCITLCKQLEEV